MREQTFLAALPETDTPWDLIGFNDRIVAVHEDHQPRIMYPNGNIEVFSDPAHEQRMCKSKRGFSKKRFAKKAAKQARKCNLGVYKCWYCPGWHMTKKRKKRRDV